MSKKTTEQINPAAPTTAQLAPKSPKKTFQDYVCSDQFKEELSLALPKHMDTDRFIRILLTATLKTPLLLQCTQESIFAGVFSAAQAGLEIDGRRAHLVPFQNRRKGCYEAVLIPDYKGVAELVIRSGAASSIHADVICDKDEFEYDRGEITKHKINLREPRGIPYAAYCIIRMKDGGMKCEVMTAEQINNVRRRSRAGDDGPWVTDTDEMWKKTVFKRASKWVPVSAEIRNVIDAEDRANEPLNVTPQKNQGFAGLIGAGNENPAPTDDPPAPEPKAQEPAPEPTFTKEEREAILKEVETAMFDNDVSESKVMLHVHANGLAKEGQDEVRALSTFVLSGLRGVIPTLKGDVKK